MRNFFKVMIIAWSLTTTIARPSNMQERNEGEAEEAEYDNSDESPAEDSVQDDDSRVNNEDPGDDGRNDETARQPLSRREREFNMRRTVAERAGNRPDNDNLMEYSRKSKEEKLEEEATSNNDPSIPNRRQSDRRLDSSYVNDISNNGGHFTDNYRANREQNDDRNNELDKRTVNSRDMPSFEDNDLIFDNQKEHRNSGDKVEYNNEVPDSAEQSRHLKQYYNTMQAEHRNMQREPSYEMAKYMNRDRRQAEQTEPLNLSSTCTEKESLLSSNVNEDDEAAIKRHIKKLTGEELEELLNSLSDDKKALLNKIMENDHNFDSLNKREITKKAGAVEENNYVDSSLSELSKNQGISSSADINTESVSAQSTNAENTKSESQTETSDSTKTKSSEGSRGDSSDNKVEFANSLKENDNNKNIEVNLNSNEDDKMSAKIKNKREANRDYLNNQDQSFDDTQFSDNYFNIKDFDDTLNYKNNLCSTQDEDLQQLTDDEVQLHKDYKREAFPGGKIVLDDSIRSLEESFPNSNCDELGKNVASNLAPLIRVKRKDENAIKKRAAGILTNTKVAYVPYKAENDDEDNDEGSEFDDDGFYDRTSNYAKSIANKPDEACPNYITNLQEEKAKVSHDKMESDTMSLGSDTDSVLSGVEGVDENLMYSGGSRNRRTPDGKLLQQSDVNTNRFPRSTPAADDPVEASNNIPNYQENDAFGALPRNYERELETYKRIKRIKPSKSVITSDT